MVWHAMMATAKVKIGQTKNSSIIPSRYKHVYSLRKLLLSVKIHKPVIVELRTRKVAPLSVRSMFGSGSRGRSPRNGCRAMQFLQLLWEYFSIRCGGANSGNKLLKFGNNLSSLVAIVSYSAVTRCESRGGCGAAGSVRTGYLVLYS